MKSFLTSRTNRPEVRASEGKRYSGRQDLFVYPGFRVFFREQDAFSFEIRVPIRYQ